MNHDIDQELTQNIKYKQEKLYWKKFEYLDNMVDWFNNHQEYKFINFTLGKEQTCFYAIYTNKEKYE